MAGQKKTVLRKQRRLILLGLVVVLMAAWGLWTAKSLQTQTITETDTLYTYTVTADVAHQAHLLENELYPDGVLPEGSLYPYRLLDYLDLTFAASFQGSQPADIQISYEVHAVVQGFQGGNENRTTVFEQQFPLLEPQMLSFEDSLASIEETIQLNLAPYHDYVNQADLLLGSKVGRSMQVVFSGEFQIATAYGEINEPFEQVLQVPLTTDLLSLQKQEPLQKTDILSQDREVTLALSTWRLFLLLIPAIVFVLAFLFLLLAVRNPTPQELYALSAQDIRRKYGSRMIMVQTMPAKIEERRTPVNSFGDLLKVADEMQRPIAYVAVNDKGVPKDGLYWVTNGVEYYAYHLPEPAEPEKIVEEDKSTEKEHVEKKSPSQAS